MAGHSKWANIRHRKGAQDAKKSKIFTKIIKEITISAKIGGGELDANPSLRSLVIKAKSFNVPRQNIEKAIKKGTGEIEGINYYDIRYEGFGPGGMAIIIDTITDNKNRTVGEIRHILAKHNGNMGENGSASYLFDKVGSLYLGEHNYDEEKLFEDMISSGADDYYLCGNECIIYSKPDLLNSVKSKLEELNYFVVEVRLEMVAKSNVDISSETSLLITPLIFNLEDHDDVQAVYSNASLA